MKKNNGLKLVLVFILVLVVTMTPVVVTAKSNARTLKELKSELNQLKQKQSSNNANKNATKSKINNAKSTISNNKNEIENNSKEIEDATQESEELSVEIEEGKYKLDKLMEVYQVAKENNTYLEYVFASKTYDELVYRSALSEQLLGYINDSIDIWNKKIQRNDELKITLAEKSAQLEKDINELSTDIDEWDQQLEQLDDVAISVADEIKSTEELIKYYQSIGCGENEDLDKCASVKGDTGFIRPLTKGTVTSYYGYRTSPTTGAANTFHSGTDIGGNAEGTAVYSIANGMVGMIIRKSSCGGNMVYVYHTIKGVQYTSCYMHLLTINVSVGQTVTANTMVGTVGGGRGTASYETCSTGAHLHLSLATGWYGRTYSSYAQWKSHLVDPRNYVNIPAKGKWFYSRY